MGGLVGIHTFDNQPVTLSLLQHLAEPIQDRAADGIEYWVEGAVGMAHLRLWTTPEPESAREKQPLVLVDEHLSLTFDGWLENRDEVITALDADPALTDAALVLRAYQHWGERCPEKLGGAFAFIIWDGREQQFFAARDISGWKPFCYYLDHRQFVWASEYPPFFQLDSIARQPNPGKVGEYLSRRMVSTSETLYAGIMRLPPAHYMVVKDGTARIVRYWGLDSVKAVRYASDADYAERFLELFTDAVHRHTRAYGRIGADLSGGLDSSSVVSVVADGLHNGTLSNGAEFETFSLVFPGLDCDESVYIDAVTQKWEVPSNRVDPRNFDFHTYREAVRRHQYVPPLPNHTMNDPLRRLAHEKGFRVLLGGFGGDDWFSGSTFYFADLMRQFNLVGLVRQYAAVRRTSLFDSSLRRILWVRGLMPLIPDESVQRLRRLLGRRDFVPGWITPAFASESNLIERTRQNVHRWAQHDSFAQASHYYWGTDEGIVHHYEMAEQRTSPLHIETRHPLRDRSIIEFGLGIPENQRWRHDTTKFVLRNAMRGLLPELVAARQTKAEFSALFPIALESMGGASFFESLHIEALGWVNGDAVRAMYPRMLQLYSTGDFGYSNLCGILWNILAIELWYRTCFEGV